MNKLVSLALLAGGVVLIVVGLKATHSSNSDVSRFFAGSPANKAIWMLIGGILVGIVGLAGMLRSSRLD